LKKYIQILGWASSEAKYSLLHQTLSAIRAVYNIIVGKGRFFEQKMLRHPIIIHKPG